MSATEVPCKYCGDSTIEEVCMTCKVQAVRLGKLTDVKTCSQCGEQRTPTLGQLPTFAR